MKLSRFSALVILANFTLCSAAAPIYQAVDLGLLGDSKETVGVDMNDRDVVIGFADENIYWTKNSGTRHTPYPIPATWAMWVINNKGSMAGRATHGNLSRAVVVAQDGGANFFLHGTWAADSLGFPGILDISNKGEILGWSAVPWLWSETLGLRPIGGAQNALEVNRLNDSGHVVGSSDSSDPFCYSRRAFIYESRSQVFTPLDGGPPILDKAHCGHFSEATALNNKGQVVGYSNLGLGTEGQNYFGFIWSRGTGVVQITAKDPRIVNIQPLDINDRGQVVGTFRYSDGNQWPPYPYFYWDAQSGLVDLQTLLDPQDPMSSDAVLWSYYSWSPRINNKGTVMVSGKLHSAQPPRTKPANRTFVLLAQPE